MSLKKIVSIIAVLTIISGITLIINEKESYTLNFVESNLNKFIEKENENNYETEIYNVIENHIVVGTITNTYVNGNLFVTKGLFIYDIANNNFNYIKYDKNNRIIDFSILNNHIYYISLEEKQNYYQWKLIEMDLNGKNQKLLKNGKFLELDEYPRFYNDNNILYLSVMDDYDNNKIFKRILNVYEINNDDIKLILTEKNNNQDNIIYYFNLIKIINSKVYYILNNNNVEKLVEYNIKNNKKYTVYKNEKNEYVISNYLYDTDTFYLNLINKNIRNSKLILNNIEKEFDVYLMYDQKINKNNILFHQNDDTWKLFNLKNNKLSNLKVVKPDNLKYYPAYFILDQNKIIIQGYDEKYYIGNIKSIL